VVSFGSDTNKDFNSRSKARGWWEVLAPVVAIVNLGWTLGLKVTFNFDWWFQLNLKSFKHLVLVVTKMTF
jgi:hypothetical protein